MGYSFVRNDRGSMVLACDLCGDGGGVRKRACPYMVRSDSLRGARHEMHYCYPPALCGACYASAGGVRGVHGARCAEGARKSQAEYDAKQQAVEAGEAFVLAAWGDWQATVPAGMVGVKFGGRDGEVWRLVAEGDYQPGERPGLSDYPGAQPWAVHP